MTMTEDEAEQAIVKYVDEIRDATAAYTKMLVFKSNTLIDKLPPESDARSILMGAMFVNTGMTMRMLGEALTGIVLKDAKKDDNK